MPVPLIVRFRKRVHRISERIDDGNPAQPHWKAFNRRNRAGRKKQQRVQHPKNRARHQRIVHAHHGKKHETNHGNRRDQNDQNQIKKAHRIPKPRNAHDQTANNRESHARHQALERARADQAEERVPTCESA